MATSTDWKQVEENLGDPYWRMNHLYFIQDKTGNKIRFKMNAAQEDLYKNSWYSNVILKSRQLGVTTFILLLFLDKALFNSDVSCGVIAHTLHDAQAIFKKAKFAYENLPQELQDLRIATTDSARELVFSNGSCLKVGTSLRGQTLQYLHISEFGAVSALDPKRTQEIVTGSLNTILPGKTYLFIESTAQGTEGKFYEICKEAQALQASKKKLNPLDFKFFFFPWHKAPEYRLDTPVVLTTELNDYFTSLEKEGITLDLEQKYWYAAKKSLQAENMLSEFPSLPEESFRAAQDGAYYGKYMIKARMDNRICKVFYDEELPVHTSWDLGFFDHMAVWMFQIAGQEIHLIEYIEDSGKPLTDYLKLLRSKPYTYGKHLAPHDIKVHELSSGCTRLEVARKHGVNFIPVPDVGIGPGIDAARNILPKCWFDESQCSVGIKCLENYKRQWNDKRGCWADKPLHDKFSNGADAFRMLSVGLRLISEEGYVSDEESERLYAKFNPSFS